jgi:hypothetical protein
MCFSGAVLQAANNTGSCGYKLRFKDDTISRAWLLLATLRKGTRYFKREQGAFYMKHGDTDRSESSERDATESGM